MAFVLTWNALDPVPADAVAFENALARAYDAARNRLLDRVHDRIVATLQAQAGDAGDNAAHGVAQAA